MPAPQNRTHNIQLINNVHHKTHEVVYARKFIPTKILDYQFFEIPRNIITRNFLRIRYTGVAATSPLVRGNIVCLQISL